MSEQSQPPQTGPDSQKLRWIKYGVNVAVMVLAVLVIVVLLNWLAYRHSAQWGRFDLTRTRQYELSPQTLGMLDRLKGDVHITMLYARGSEMAGLFQAVRDTLEEYRRRSDHITVEQVDPTDAPAFDKFLDKTLGRYKNEIDHARGELKASLKAFDEVRTFAAKQAGELPDAVAKTGGDTQSAQILAQLHRVFSRIDPQLRLKDYQDKIDEELTQKLPDFRSAKNAATQPLSALSSLLKQAIDAFSDLGEAPQSTPAVKDVMLGLRREYEAEQKQIQSRIDQLNKIDTKNYDNLRSKIRGANSVVIALDNPAAPPTTSAVADSKDRGVVVLGLDDIYPNLREAQLKAQLGDADVHPDAGYKGEEVVTGALLRLTYKHNTKVVFLNPYPVSVLNGQSPQASFAAVADTLRKMNCDVTEWQPGGGGIGPNGMPRRPEPRPTADPGQTMIFIALPSPPPSPQRPYNPATQAIANAMKEQIDAGQPAMIFAAPSPLMSMGQADPVLDLLKPFDISVDRGRVVLTTIPSQNQHRPRTVSQLEITDWPSDNPIGKALSGLRGIAIQAMPITLPAKTPKGVTLWPLAKTAADGWADTEYMDLQHAKRDSSDPSGPFTIAVAASKGSERIVVVSDPLFASDYLTTAGPQDVFGRPLYSMFPANAELFTNSVYWLAGLDPLIAPGARSHDIRRLGAITPGAMAAVWWLVLAGLPIATLAAGTAVWVVRRK